jgi:hypothetical protein
MSWNGARRRKQKAQAAGGIGPIWVYFKLGEAELQRMETPTDRMRRQQMLALSAPVFHPL